MSGRGARPDVQAALRACLLWRAASDGAVARLSAAASADDVPRGARLVTAGDAATRLGVVVVGKARVYHLGADGRQIVFETLGAGEPLAAVAALAGTRYPANIDTTTPATVAWLDREEVLDLLDREPTVARSLVTDLANRLVGFTTMATTLSLDVPRRLARFLFLRALQAGSPTASGLLVDLGMSKTELAASLGTVPETLSRALARLREDGLIEVRARDVIVLDMGALAKLGEGYEEG